jgi:hypothetical protein
MKYGGTGSEEGLRDGEVWKHWSVIPHMVGVECNLVG